MNVDGICYVVEVVKVVGVIFVYVSIDYIFDGIKKEGVYVIDD